MHEGGRAGYLTARRQVLKRRFLGAGERESFFFVKEDRRPIVPRDSRIV
jgi:hypothetical protein